MSDEKHKKELNVVISPLVSRFSEFDAGEHAVFVVQEEGPDFRGVTCLGAAVLIAKAQFGLGDLSTRTIAEPEAANLQSSSECSLVEIRNHRKRSRGEEDALSKFDV